MKFFLEKKPWGFSRPYMADYLEMESNPLKQKYIAGMQKLFNTYGETEVLFSEYAIKVNRKGKSQRRAIVVTGKTIYKQDPNNYKVKKGELPLSEITDICLSPNSDTFVIVRTKSPYRDLVVDFGITGPEKYSEFVTVISNQFKYLTHNSVSVQFLNSLKYNNSREQKSNGVDCNVTFEKNVDPKLALPSVFRQGKNNQHKIVYK